MSLTELWDAVAAHFFTPPSFLERVDVMTKAQIQVESWWKVEMMLLLTEMQEQTNIRSWHTEVRGRTSRRRLDFKIEFQGHDTAVLELKTALCGVQMIPTY